MKLLPNSKECFVCGEENPAGLKARFFVEDGVVKTRWRPEACHCGYENVVHGGVIAAMLDECMAWAATRSMGRMCVTGELTIRYFARVPGGRDYTVKAHVAQPGRRLVHIEASVADDEGGEYAKARGKFVPMSAEETIVVDDSLLYRGGEERVFDALREQMKNGTNA